MSAALAGFSYHTELIDGREIEKPLPKNLHAFVQTFLIGFFLRTLSARYRVASELNLLCGPDRLVPDLTVMARDARYLDGDLADAAVLAVEIFSPGQTVNDLFDKCRRITDAGTKLCWVIWPENRKAWMYSINDTRQAETSLSVKIDEQEISVPLAEMWAELD